MPEAPIACCGPLGSSAVSGLQLDDAVPFGTQYPIEAYGWLSKLGMHVPSPASGRLAPHTPPNDPGTPASVKVCAQKLRTQNPSRQLVTADGQSAVVSHASSQIVCPAPGSSRQV